MTGAPALESDIRDLLAPAFLKKCTEHWNLDQSRPLILIGCARRAKDSAHTEEGSRKDSRNELYQRSHP